MNEQLEQLKKTFHEIFQTDQAELDFGIYRVMREKREEFDRYLEKQLLDDLRQSFRKWQDKTSEDLQRQLNEAINAAIALGYDPDASPKVKELRETIEAVKHREGLEESVLSDLVQFLGRYYKEGDFLSLPRYRKNSYAIEYNGEEVKLHWANADQYYVKTAERFRDYRFRFADGRAVHFKIKAANTEAGDNKAQNGKERRFQLVEDEFMREENGELLVFFCYEADEQKRKQAEINTETARRMLEESEGFLEWRKALAKPVPTEKNKDRTLLDKHIAEYTARNTFDYFIHKDLEGFLRRELDFFIKNEIVMLDDIENEDAPRVELYLAKVKALRRVGHKLIKFLAQVENFQKKLFLKKKFVIRADYCLTLDRVPRELWADVLANDEQISEWRRLYAIDEIEADLFNGGNHLTEQFLEANQNLIVDTRYFSEAWKMKLLASFDDLDAETGGVLIKADNFHALNLLREKYREVVKCIYIDPPYNTGSDDFMYKDGYQHSSWLAMMENRLELARQLMSDDSAIFMSLDDVEQSRGKLLFDIVFGDDNLISNVIWQKKYSPQNDAKWFSNDHDFIVTYSKNKSVYRPKKLPRTEGQDRLYINPDDDPRGSWKPSDYTSNKSAQERPNLYYPIINPFTQKEVLPSKNRVWAYTREQHELNMQNNRVWWGPKGENKVPSYKRFLKDVAGVVPRTIWFYQEVGHTQDAARELLSLFAENVFNNPKPSKLIGKVVRLTEEILTLDFFAGSGTTAHAVINLNREDGGKRKYILVETNEYFDSVTLPRIKKVVYAKEWKDGKPKKREGSSHVLKYFALESYEDAMNNLELRRTEEQEQGLLNFTNGFYEDYLLNYMLEFEAQGSQSLLNLDNFAAPFDYRMKIAVNGVGETQETPIDLVETFNYLIGLNVQRTQQIDGFRVVRGVTRKGERCLILWRTIKGLNQELADKRLIDFLEKQNFDFAEVDTLYINGDAAIPVGNVRKETDTWQIKLIEAEFLRRMFE